MLTATTKAGANICLAEDFSRQELEEMRKRVEFNCPSCGEKVILKLGNRRIYHFAHLKSACAESGYERESQYHLAGKLALFKWLKSQGIPARVEQYDPAIRQRPDIVFLYQNLRYALEFQCSPIPDHLFMKRTETYFQNGYIPLWILGGKHLAPGRGRTVSLSGFHYLFYRSLQAGRGYIPYFCPDQGLFSIVHSICPYSPTKAFAKINKIGIGKAGIQQILIPPAPVIHPKTGWVKKLEHTKITIGMNMKPPNSRFLNDLYEAGMNIFLLPPEIGLPGYASAAISTFPVIWQTYLYMDVFSKKAIGEPVSVTEAVSVLMERMGKGEVRQRQLPLSKDSTIEAAVHEYLSHLTRFGLLEERAGEFILKKQMDLPKNTTEQMEMAARFYAGIRRK